MGGLGGLGGFGGLGGLGGLGFLRNGLHTVHYPFLLGTTILVDYPGPHYQNRGQWVAAHSAILPGLYAKAFWGN